MSYSWLPLPASPQAEMLSNLVPIDNHSSFLTIAAKKATDKTITVLIFNTRTNTWQQRDIADHANRSILSSHCIAIDSSSNKLFSCGAHHMLVIELSTNTSSMRKTTEPIAKHQNCSILAMQDKLHVIGGKQCQSHIVYDAEIPSTDFNKLSEYQFHNTPKCGIQKAAFVHIPSKGICLAFGGFAVQPYFTYSARASPVNIWRYSIAQNEWTLLAVKMPAELVDFGYCLTVNERYLLMFGGWVNQVPQNKILVLDLESMTFAMSRVKLPEFRKWFDFHAIALIDRSLEVAVNYMIAQQFGRRHSFPLDVFALICQWVSTEYVYLVERIMGKLWKLNVHEILFNAKENDVRYNPY